MTVTGLALSVGVFSLWSVGTILVQEVRMAKGIRSIARTNLAYSSVVEEMTASQRRFIQLATEIQSEQTRVITLLEERISYRDTLDTMNLMATEQPASGISRKDIIRRLEEIESELVIASRS